MEREGQLAGSRAAGALPAADAATGDPLDPLLWGMQMINAPAAHQVSLGDPASPSACSTPGSTAVHPDLTANFSRKLSRNFTTDMPDLDGPCEFASCVDPADWDDNGHGTHVAGTIGAAANGFGLTGVAPGITLVDIRGGQDSGYFFLGPVTRALTYAGDVGLDVVNMSFYLDPWLYNCAGGSPADSPEAAQEQDVTIEAMNRAITYATQRKVTLVASLGNNHEDLANPRDDVSSPDYGADPYTRPISNANCRTLPVEGSGVIGVSSVGPSRTKSDFSNYTTDLTSGEIELSAPGGWFRDGFGTDSYRTIENEVLSTAPVRVLQSQGLVDDAGDVTEAGLTVGVKKACNDTGQCGYYQYLQGTSMAAPHAAGVAALAVSGHGREAGRPARGLTLSPWKVGRILAKTAVDQPCPAGGVRSYVNEGRDASFDATCTGTPALNGFYGAGIVDALAVLR